MTTYSQYADQYNQYVFSLAELTLHVSREIGFGNRMEVDQRRIEYLHVLNNYMAIELGTYQNVSIDEQNNILTILEKTSNTIEFILGTDYKTQVFEFYDYALVPSGGMPIGSAVQVTLSFLDLIDTPKTYNILKNRFVAVNATHTGLEFVEIAPEDLNIHAINGLTYDDATETLKLGGELTDVETRIFGDGGGQGRAFAIDLTEDLYEMASGLNLAASLYSNSANLYGESSTVRTEVHVSSSNAYLAYYMKPSYLETSITLDGYSNVVRDDITLKGLSYYAKYHDANVDNLRWLTDKEYVDSKVGSLTDVYVRNQNATIQLASAWLGNGGEVLKLGTNTDGSDFAYIGLYPHKASPATQKGQIGFLTAGSNKFEIKNTIGGGHLTLTSNNINLETNFGFINGNAVNTTFKVLGSFQIGEPSDRFLFKLTTGVMDYMYGTGTTTSFTRVAGSYVTAPGDLYVGEKLVNISFRGVIPGYGSPEGASLQVVTTEDWLSTATGAKFEFYTNKNGTIYMPVLALTIDHDGALIHTGDRTGTATGGLGVDANGRLVNMPLPTVGIGGSGTANIIPKFSNGTTLTNSILVDDGAGHIGIATMAPTHALTLPSSMSTSGIALYNTSDQTVNYERLRIFWSGNTSYIFNELGGTGGLRSLVIATQNNTITLNPVGGAIAINLSRGSGTANTTSVGVTGSHGTNSGFNNGLGILSEINQTGTAGFRSLWISPNERTVGSGIKYLIDAGINSAANGAGTHTSKFTVDNQGNGLFVGSLTVQTRTGTPVSGLAVDATGKLVNTSLTPDLSNYMTLDTAQSVTGLKNFLTAPTISGSTIWHSGNFDPTSVANSGQTGSFLWRYDTVTTATDPGVGFFRINNASPSLATQLYIDDLTSSNQIDVSFVFTHMQGTWSIYIQQRNVAEKWAHFRLNGDPIDNNGWWTLPVTFQQQGSGGLIDTTTECLFTLVNENQSDTGNYVTVDTPQTITGLKNYTTAPTINGNTIWHSANSNLATVNWAVKALTIADTTGTATKGLGIDANGKLVETVLGGAPPDLSGYVTLATAQTITGAKTFTQTIVGNANARLIGAPNITDISYGVGDDLSSGRMMFVGWRYNGGNPYGVLETYASGAHIIMQGSGPGNVGIGVAPTEKLHVNGTILGTTIKSEGDLITVNNKIQFTNGGAHYLQLYVPDNKWYLNGANDMMLNGNTVWHSGNFTPGNYLSLSGGTLTGDLNISKDNGGLWFSRTNVVKYSGVHYATAGVQKWFLGVREIGNDMFSFYNYTKSKNAITIRPENSHVGIGTEDPMWNLVVSLDGTIGFEVAIPDANTVVYQTYDRSVGAYKNCIYAAAEHRFQNGSIIGDGYTLRAIKNTVVEGMLYERGNVELRTTDGSAPAIGFHRAGYEAGSLYYTGDRFHMITASGAVRTIWDTGHFDPSQYAKALTYAGTDLNVYIGQGLFMYDGNLANDPIDSNNIRVLSMGTSGRWTQMAFDWISDRVFFRRNMDGNFQPWYEFYHTGNLGAPLYKKVWSIGTAGEADAFRAGHTFSYAGSGTPFSGPIISFGGLDGNYDCQIGGNYNNGYDLYYRTRQGDGGYWNGWYTLWGSGNFSIGRENWSGTTLADRTAGFLAWRNYGNGHIIFDASQGLAPNGVGIDRNNAQITWGYDSSLPNLMGWNGSNTYGVRVDTARYADSAGGASNTTHYSGRTDGVWYNVVWASGSPSPLYSSNGVQILSSESALSASGYIQALGGSGLYARIGGRNTWGGTYYPTIYGAGSADEFIMLHRPHVPYLQNGAYGWAGSVNGSLTRYAIDIAGSAHYDTGVHPSKPDSWGVSRANGTPSMWIDNFGTLHSDAIGSEESARFAGITYSDNFRGASIIVSGTAIDFNSRFQTRSVSGSTTFSFSNNALGKSTVFVLTNSSASTITVTFPSGTKIENQTANSHTVGANKTVIQILMNIGGTVWVLYGTV